MEWYRIEAKANRKAVVQVYGYIGDSWDSESVTAKKFFKQVNDLDVDEIELHINSQGGSVPDGNAIYNLLKAHKAAVRVVIDGWALSAASVVAMAGDTVEMPENAMMMIHDPMALVGGNASDMRKTADVLDKWKTGLVAAYRDKTGLPEDRIERMMSDETWMTAKEAALLGFADTVTGAVEIEACFDEDALKRFRHAPAEFVNLAIRKPLAKEEPQNMEITAEFLKKNHPAIVAALIAEAITAAYLKEKHPAVAAELAAEGRTAERERIQAVLASSMPGHEDLVHGLAFDGKTTAAEAAVQILAAEKQIRAGVVAKLGKDAVKPLGHVEPPVVDPAKPEFMALVEAHMKEAKCRKSEAIQAVRASHPALYDAWLKSQQKK